MAGEVHQQQIIGPAVAEEPREPASQLRLLFVERDLDLIPSDLRIREHRGEPLSVSRRRAQLAQLRVRIL